MSNRAFVAAAWLCLAAVPAVAANGPAETIAACDSLGADPEDVDRPAGIKGVADDDMDKQTAILVCRAAVRAVEAGGAVGARVAVDTRRIYYQLGRALDVADSSTEARTWLVKAAEAGSIQAMLFLASLHVRDAFATLNVTANYVAARGWYEKAAAAGRADAMVSIGWLYENGYGADKDYGLAKSWYQKAVAAGSPAGMIALGNLYLSGQGVGQSDVAARALFEKAVAADPSMGFNVGFAYVMHGDLAAGLPFLEKAAASGNVSAMALLGTYYAMENSGIPQDYAAARGWFERAAALGHVESMVHMGDLYANGQGVAKNIVAARAWYEKASAQGSTDARSKLAALPGG